MDETRKRTCHVDSAPRVGVVAATGRTALGRTQSARLLHTSIFPSEILEYPYDWKGAVIVQNILFLTHSGSAFAALDYCEKCERGLDYLA